MTENLVEMARAAMRDERLSDGALYGKLADEIERLRRVLQQFADNQLSDENCASVELAGRRIRGVARAALNGVQQSTTSESGK